MLFHHSFGLLNQTSGFAGKDLRLQLRGSRRVLKTRKEFRPRARAEMRQQI